MIRLRMATLAVLAGLGLAAGCANMGSGCGMTGGGFFSRFHRNTECECGGCCVSPGYLGGGCSSCPTCEGGCGAPGLPTGAVMGGPVMPGGPVLPPQGEPPILPQPRMDTAPQAQPLPATPTVKIR